MEFTDLKTEIRDIYEIYRYYRYNIEYLIWFFSRKIFYILYDKNI